MYRVIIIISLLLIALFIKDIRDIPRYSHEQVLAIATDFSPHCKLEVVN